MSGIKITQLEAENIKRIRAVAISFTENGMTIIGGDNNQGKTSALNTIAWGLGGDRFKPSEPTREGSTVPPRIKLTLSNGLTVERSGKNGALKVTDPSGQKGGQQLLNEFVEELALNLPKFMEQNNREKADTLLRIIGVGDRLHSLENREATLYNRRREIGLEADRKKKYAEALDFYPDAPKEPVSILDLIQRQQTILAKNGENQRKRQNLADLKSDYNKLCGQVEDLKSRLEQLTAERDKVYADIVTAQKSAEELQDESTEQLERDIANIESINIKVRANCDREKAEQDAAYYKNQYDAMTQELEAARKEKYDLLSGADLPLPGLSVEDGELTYNGRKWDAMSGSDQLRISTAIVRAINPKCGFVLLDKLEQMDRETLREFGAWVESQGLQVIATRVSKGDECSIIIEDGYAVPASPEPKPAKKWEAGVF